MIRLEKISYSNYEQCLSLNVSEDQRSYVAPNVHSLIHAYIELSEGNGVPMPYAIFNDDEMVGFIMLSFCKGDPEEAESTDAYCVWRFMIDAKFQKLGYGKAALTSALELVKTFPYGKAPYIAIYVEPDNVVANKLYENFGFVPTGKMLEGEIELRLDI